MNYKVVSVVFVDAPNSPTSQKEYAYFTDFDLDKGDIVVVQARDFCGLARVTKSTGLTRQERDNATRWVLNKVDFQSVEDKEAKMSLIQEIKRKLHEAKERFEEEQIYRLLAKDDPEIEKLLGLYNQLMLA